MDRRKYDEYKEEIMSGGNFVQTNINSSPNIDVAPVDVQAKEEVPPPPPEAPKN